MVGRIGVAKRTHIIEKHVPGDGYIWATAYCGWTGTFTETEDEEPTCFACKTSFRNAQRQEQAEKKED